MKIHKLRIANFGCYGEDGIEILIDNIVVLIGRNDVGKSTILDAYEAFASVGAPLPIDKFHRRDASRQVSIEAEFAEVSDEDSEALGGDKWIHDLGEGVRGVRARYVWTAPGEKGKKQAFDPIEGKWTTGGLGGWETKLKSRVPKPVRLRPDSKAEDLESVICSILIDAVKAAVKNDGDTGKSILTAINELADQFRVQVDNELSRACVMVTSHLAKVFPGYSVQFVPGTNSFDPVKVLGSGGHVEIQGQENDQTRLIHRGAGVQRSFVWSALAALADLGKKINKQQMDSESPKVLLIEEPESFLHPPAIRRARESLYQIADVAGWQIICNTHSPIFIDVSKPHTTIIRVWKVGDAAASIKTYQSDKAAFSDREMDQLRMVRACNPQVAEFFFADNVWVVEGDTEELAFNELLQRHAPDVDVHVLNAVGKANIPLFARILAQFGSSFVLIHDSDCPKSFRKSANKYIRNSAWANNLKIAAAIPDPVPDGASCRCLVHVPDFERHYFGVHVPTGKPDFTQSVLSGELEDSVELLDNLSEIVQAILDGTHSGFYRSTEEVEGRVKAWVSEANPAALVDEELWNFED